MSLSLSLSLSFSDSEDIEWKEESVYARARVELHTNAFNSTRIHTMTS